MDVPSVAMRRTLVAALSVIVVAAAGCSARGEHLPSGLVARQLPPAPVERSEGVVACVTGTQFSVWQLNNVRASGATFDRASQSWRTLPKPFLRAFGTAMCNDTGLYWLGSRGRQTNPGQVFDLKERRWHPLPASPLDNALWVTAVAVGHNLLAIGQVKGENVGAFFDRSRRTWSTVSLPQPLRTLTYPPTLVATGDDVIALRPLHDVVGRAVTLRYDVANRRWTALGVSPNIPGAGVQYAATDHELIVFGELPRTENGRDPARLFGARLDLTTGKWRAMADPPDIGYDGDEDLSRANTLQAAWTGSALMVWTSFESEGIAPNIHVPVLAYSPALDQWATLGTVNAKRHCTIPEGNAVWTGREMVIFCSDGVIGLRPRNS